jgi:hypothetical protein
MIFDDFYGRNTTDQITLVATLSIWLFDLFDQIRSKEFYEKNSE